MSQPTEAADETLPAGVVTFLLTDVEGSGTHWASNPKAMAASLRELDSCVGAIVGRNDGVVLKARGEGDSHFAVFARPSRAVLAACELQARLAEGRVGTLDLRVRMGVHSGELDPVEDDYYGVPVNQTARLRSLAHGRQTVVSRATAFHVEPILAGQVRLKSLGFHTVRDFQRPEEVFQATPADADHEFPPLRTSATRGPSLLAVVIVDICGASDLIIDRRGLDLVGEQRRWLSTIRRLAEAHGSASLKLLGDGCLIAFEDPAAGIAFAQSLRAALTQLGLQIRSGVDAGRVELFDGEVIGQATFVAAELTRLALPGQVVMTGTFRALSGGTDTSESIGLRMLQATGHEVELFAL